MQVGKVRAWGERADYDTSNHEAQNQRQAEAPCQQPSQHGGQKYVGQIAKQNRIGFHFLSLPAASPETLILAVKKNRPAGRICTRQAAGGKVGASFSARDGDGRSDGREWPAARVHVRRGIAVVQETLRASTK